MTDIVPFNYDEIYTDVEQLWKDAGYDVEPGSNVSQLTVAMAYMISMLNANTSLNVREVLLNNATKRDMALNDARVLGYETIPVISYRYLLNITAPIGTTIEKYSEYISGDKSYYYMGKTFLTTSENIQIPVKEGTLYLYSENSDTLSVIVSETDNNQSFIDIPYPNVEANSIELFLTYYDEYGILHNKELWTKSTEFLVDADTQVNQNFFRVDNIDFKTPRVYFSLNGIGSILRSGTIVEINILTSSGSSGIATGDFTSTNSAITAISISDLLVEGIDEESLESIRKNAPIFHNSANRAVTVNDYIAICNRFSSVKDSQVWGGDDEYPKSPGYVWFSFLPAATSRTFSSDLLKNEFTLDNPESIDNWYIQNKEIRSNEYTEDGIIIDKGVWDILDNYKIPSIRFQNRHPLYLDFMYDIEIIKYNISDSKSDVHQAVFDIVNNAFSGSDLLEYEKFGTEYFNSNVVKRIDTYISDDSGFNLSLTNRLVLSSKNITTENSILTYNDIFIPLGFPFEEFDITKMPNIDTDNFIDDISIFTDWTEISDGSILKIAPIKSKQSQTIISNGGSTLSFDIENYYDDIEVEVNGISRIDFTILVDLLTFDVPLILGDSVKVTVKNLIGYYHIFNGYRKEIIVQLFVNGTGYVDEGDASEEDLINIPKSYITTSDGFYIFTNDSFYITTNGYAIKDSSNATAITGEIAREVSSNLYEKTTLKRDAFDKFRYMNFQYNSSNFKVIRNMIPRLKTVTFN